MPFESLLLNLAIVITAAEIGSIAFKKLQLSPVLGMFIAGIILGPFTPGLTIDPASISDIAELGAVFLMFNIGLEMDLQVIGKVKYTALFILIMGASVSFVAGLLLGLGLGWSLRTSAFLGAMLVATSTTTALRLMSDLGARHTMTMEAVAGSIVLDDLAGLIVMSVVSSLFVGELTSLPMMATGLVLVVVLMLVIIYLGSKIIPLTLDVTSMASPGSEVLFAIAICFIFAFVFSFLNLSSYMGAFFAGSIIASTKRPSTVSAHTKSARYSSTVSIYIKSLSDVFSGIFFVSMGMLVDPTNILPILPVALLISVVSMVKFFGGFIPIYLKKAPIYDAIAAGIYLIPKGEVAIIVAGYGISIGVLGSEFLSIGAVMMIFTTLITTLAARFIRNAESESSG
jgi:CPA2 family monovalent cation:H+ antiporter-2